MILKNQNKFFFSNSKYVTIFFFIGLAIIGYSIHKDYGISADEESTRFHGLVSLNYICDVFFPYQKFQFQIDSQIPKLNEYEYRQYGVFFEILLVAIIEIFFEIKNFSEIFYNRHLANHLLFIGGVICFYFLCFSIFKNKLYSFLGAIILYTSPRIFAQSFYNDKDLVFLSFFIFLIYFSIKFIKQPLYYNAFLLALFSAFANNIRIIGIYVVFLVAFFLIIQMLMDNKFNLKKMNSLLVLLFFNFLFLYIFWPFLWEAPLDNIVHAIKTFSKYPWDGSVFYFGSFYKSEFLPWHYLLIYFVATTPIILSIIIICGILHVTLRFVKRFININENNSYKDIWRSEKEKIFLFLLVVIITPIFLIYFLNSRLFNGWRHLYFLLPCLILMGIYFADRISLYFFKNKMTIITAFILGAICINNFYNLVKLHPYQYVYFNFIFEKKANKLFEIDYWGVSNKNALETLVKNNFVNDKLVIGTASFTNLNLSKRMLPNNLKNKIILSGQDYENADFIFNNNIFEINPKFDNKYIVPKMFKKYKTLKKGNILINEFYKKK